MKSEQLAKYAALVEGPGNCGEHREAINSLLSYAHDLECRGEILNLQVQVEKENVVAIIRQREAAWKERDCALIHYRELKDRYEALQRAIEVEEITKRAIRNADKREKP